MNMVQLFVMNMLVVLYVSQGGSRRTQEDVKFEAVICKPTLDEQYGEDPIYPTEKRERGNAQNRCRRMLSFERCWDLLTHRTMNEGTNRTTYPYNESSPRLHNLDRDWDCLAESQKEEPYQNTYFAFEQHLRSIVSGQELTYLMEEGTYKNACNANKLSPRCHRFDQVTFLGVYTYIVHAGIAATAFHDVLDDPGTPGWFRTAAELGYEMMSRGADAETLVTPSMKRTLWAREKYKREREHGPMQVDQSTQGEIPEFTNNLVDYIRRCMLAQQFNELQYYPPCWGHDAYDQSNRGRWGTNEDDGSSTSSSSCALTHSSPSEDAARARSRSRTPARQMSASTMAEEKGDKGASEDTELTNLVQKKWLLKARRPKSQYQTAKMIWQSARPEYRTTSTRTLDPTAPRSLLARRCSSAPWHRTDEEMETEEVIVEVPDEDTGGTSGATSSVTATGVAEGPEAG
ncbi:hypothetical protein AK812_SmicGene24348 [Symbiodinium microadriaticum]|uniref:Uncharacterized protein n=1 Tax=Symbiodinium microadriaticum TaxID=2951 RepID=A0A1Q9DEV1_SYMMI|nr:hypothetical protein AK812_SmicGene24348 [Symbiodinium microadriaticum]